MSHTDIVFLSGLLWLVVGFFIGRHHHALQVRDLVARRTKRMAWEWLCWRAAVKEVTGKDVGPLPKGVVALTNPKKMLEEARN